jgi:hypothetical protein
MEIFTLTIKLIFGEVDEAWERVIEISEDATLSELHLFIQKIIEFDNDHMYEFYAGRNWRNRKIQYTEEGATPIEDNEFGEILLKDIYPLPSGLKLYYLFDFGDNWTFEIKKSRKKEYVKEGIKYPRAIGSHGANPEQYPSGEE